MTTTRITPETLAREMPHWGLRLSPDRLMAHLEPRHFARPRHIRHMGQQIARVAHEPNVRLIVQVSVRSGKSWLGSWATPLWYLECWPQRHVAMATYQANFSALWGRRVRNAIQRHEDQLRVRVAGDSAAAHSWETTQGGGMHTAGVGGEFTGRGFDLLLVDDPVKNAEEANSEVYREKVWDWWQTTAYTRLEPGGSAIIIMARWHQDDLAGRLIRQMQDGGEHWDVIDLPAIAKEGDALGRKPGQALWPQRYDEQALERIKQAVGPRTWSALYQQSPTPDEGGMFKREYIRYFNDADDWYVCHEPNGKLRKVLKSDCWRFITVDTAMTEKTHSDYTVRMVWDVEKHHEAVGGTRPGAMFLVDLWRTRSEAPKVEAQLRTDLIRWQPAFIGIEDKNDGKVLCQRFRNDGLPVKPIAADRDKITRATIAEVWMSAGRVYFPVNAPWLGDLESELLVFPNGSHDDQVDTLAHAVAFANNRDLWTSPRVAKYAKGTMGHIAEHHKLHAPTAPTPKQARKAVWK